MTATGTDETVVTSLCRLCLGHCGIEVTVVDGLATKVTGDSQNPHTRGFTCIKGRTMPEQLADPHRLLHSMERQADGSYAPIAVADAVDAIAARLADILEAHGPRSVASYLGTGSAAYLATQAVGFGFLQAIGSPMFFHPGSIDQPGKQVAQSMHGRWSAGTYDLPNADVWVFIGTNPVVTMWGGLSVVDPVRLIRDARRRGMRMIVIDPRRTELASMADLHLRPRPGEDAALLAGLVRLVLTSGRYDRDFATRNVQGVDALQQAVAPFTPAEVEARTGVTERELLEAVDILVSSHRGAVTAGTGANMTPNGSVTEALGLALHTLCGYWRRAGDVVSNPGVLVPPRVFREEPDPATAPLFGKETMRARGLRETSAGLPTAALADEILYDGPDRVRALINMGGNPVAAWPDQLRTLEAMRALDLLVSFDIRMGATSRRSDYVIACKYQIEVPQVTGAERSINMYGATSSQFPVPYAMYTPAAVRTPAGSELVEEWEVFLAVAAKLGVSINVAGNTIDPGDELTTDDLYEMLYAAARIPLSEVRKYEHGHVFDDGPAVLVEPREEGNDAKLEVGHELVVAALGRLAATSADAPDGAFPYRLICRRMKHSKNSSGLDVEALRGKWRVNPAFMSPDDMGALGLADGDAVKVCSERATIPAIAVTDETVPNGVVSMTHAFGDGPERDDEFREIGSSTGRLTDNTRAFDPLTGMPMMTAIPVAVQPA